jgi:nucleotide-binding universal stress UspA family protein
MNRGVQLRKILVAVDGSKPSLHALEVGTRLARQARAEWATLQVGERGPGSPWRNGVARGSEVTLHREGVPGIEIARCAEQWNADLVIMGRKEPPDGGLGRTIEMVLRRRHGPVLLIPPRVTELAPVLFALDGSQRGLGSLDGGGGLPALLGARVQAVCVLPEESVPVSAELGPHPRQVRVESAMDRRPDLGGRDRLMLRHGDPVQEVLRCVEETSAQLLVLGLRQGGPGGDPGSGHVARDLLGAAPVALLTIPI